MPSPELTVDFDSRPPDDEGLVMAMLSSESDAIYSFQGMRRRLGLHQEKLTRILKRLEGDKLALKTDEGYRVLRSLRRTARNIMSEEPVIKGRLPPGVEPMAITSKLKGRWFKNFRWLGYASGQNTQTLYWITEDSKFQVGVQLSPLEVLVWSQPTDGGATASSVGAGYEIFDRISRIIPEGREYS